MRVVFFGTPDFAVPSLAALLDAGVDVAAVITQPDRPKGRSHSTLIAPPVKQRALAAGLPVWQPERPRGDDFYRQMRDARPDLGVVIAYGHLLVPELLTIPRLGLVNVHASLLPRWRGAAPIQRALLAGDAETGITIMRVEAGLDTGAVWATRRTPIGERDTSATLFSQLARLGADALIAALPHIAAGDAPTPQPDTGVTRAAKIDRATARIDWTASATAVSCCIRAMDPAPGAWTTFDGAELKLFGGQVVASSGMPAGSIVDDAGALIVATGDAAVSIVEAQPAGKRRMPAAEWRRGVHRSENSRFV